MRKALPTWLLAIALTACCYVLVDALREGAERQGAIPSAAIVAMLVGVLIGNLLPKDSPWKAGSRSIIKGAIPLAIVFMGAGLDLSVLADPRVGLGGLAVTFVAIGAALALGILTARALGLSRNTQLLLGVGTAICGSSAILATSPIIDAEEDELVLTVATVNLMGLIAMFAIAPLAHALGLTEQASGVLAGTTIHAIPQAIASGDAMGDTAATFATLFKLVRVSMLAPVVLLVGALARKHNTSSTPQERPARTALVPWFLWGFAALAVLHSFELLEFAVALPGIESAPFSGLLNSAGKALLAVAMIAIGFELPLAQMIGVGGRALLAGLLSTAGLIAVVLGLLAAAF